MLYFFDFDVMELMGKNAEKKIIKKDQELSPDNRLLDRPGKQIRISYVTQIHKPQIFRASLIKSILTPLNTHSADRLSHKEEALRGKYAWDEGRLEKLLIA